MPNDPRKVVYKFAPVGGGEVKDDLYTVTLSDSSVDRHGDTVSVDGWKLEAFKANPVLLFGHDSDALPIGKVLNVRTEGAKLKGEIKFASHEFAQTVKTLVDEGFLSTVSVGFAPIEAEEAKDRESRGYFPAVDFKSQELLELSIVPVPANPNARIEGRAKCAGFNPALIAEWAHKALTQHMGEGRWVPRSALSAIEAPVPTPAPATVAPVAAPILADVSPKEIAELVRKAISAAEMQLTGKID